jgi:magnesium-transporting ATPase (P-type)
MEFFKSVYVNRNSLYFLLLFSIITSFFGFGISENMAGEAQAAMESKGLTVMDTSIITSNPELTSQLWKVFFIDILSCLVFMIVIVRSCKKLDSPIYKTQSLLSALFNVKVLVGMLISVLLLLIGVRLLLSALHLDSLTDAAGLILDNTFIVENQKYSTFISLIFILYLFSVYIFSTNFIASALINKKNSAFKTVFVTFKSLRNKTVFKSYLFEMVILILFPVVSLIPTNTIYYSVIGSAASTLLLFLLLFLICFRQINLLRIFKIKEEHD